MPAASVISWMLARSARAAGRATGPPWLIGPSGTAGPAQMPSPQPTEPRWAGHREDHVFETG